MRKQVIGFSIGSPYVTSGGYRHVEIAVAMYAPVDAVQQIGNWLHNADQADYYRRRACQVKEATGGTIYYERIGIADGLRFDWQDDAERRGQWYGQRVGFEARPILLTLLAKLARHFAPNPLRNVGAADFVAGLLALGAILLTYGECDVWLPVKDFDPATKLETPKPAEATPEAQADTPAPAAALV